MNLLASKIRIVLTYFLNLILLHKISVPNTYNQFLALISFTKEKELKEVL